MSLIYVGVFKSEVYNNHVQGDIHLVLNRRILEDINDLYTISGNAICTFSYTGAFRHESKFSIPCVFEAQGQKISSTFMIKNQTITINIVNKSINEYQGTYESNEPYDHGIIKLYKHEPTKVKSLECLVM